MSLVGVDGHCPAGVGAGTSELLGKAGKAMNDAPPIWDEYPEPLYDRVAAKVELLIWKYFKRADEEDVT